MKWNSTLYDGAQGFVSAYGQSLLGLVPPGARRVLDLGCGTGDLTGRLAALAPWVLGVDASPEMIDAARAKYPALRFAVMDAANLPFAGAFDVVFSNAVFHWLTGADAQAALLAGVRRALKPGGVLICEFGAAGNIAAIQAAFTAALARRGLGWHSPFFFPTAGEYRALLEQAGFAVEELRDYDRPTPLPNGEEGLSAWLRQFFSAALSPLDAAAQDAILAETADALRPALWDAAGGRWVADYRRLRAVAHTRPGRDPALGSTVTVTVNRPLGTAHPDHPALRYPVNYGFIEGITAPDGEAQDAYILGVDRPVAALTGRVAAILRRKNDGEDKWVVLPAGCAPLTAAEILRQVHFQEQYFDVAVEL